MRYVGMQTQQDRNNRLSLFLLLAFPCIVLGMVWVFIAVIGYFCAGYETPQGDFVSTFTIDMANGRFIEAAPWVIGVVGVWFAIAYWFNAEMVKQAVGSRPLERKENPRVYNIVENLCMTCNMDMPKVNVVDDPQLNAFASGINKDSYAVTVTTGLLDVLDDNELSGVIAHELTHIRNRDTRLLITSIVFVGIISTVMTVVVRVLINTFVYDSDSRRDRDSKNGFLSIVVVLLIALACTAIAYLFILLTRFALSRKREYMADAGGAELCGDPLALASALRKISGNPGLDSARPDVAQLFIARPDAMESGFLSFMDGLFSTHPDIEKRIEILEQF